MISSAGNLPPTPEWVYAKATGAASTTSQLYLYLSGAGECYIDDLKLVVGTNAEVGPNLLVNGDFEAPLASSWVLTTNFANSTISSTVARSGAGSLRLMASNAGSGSGNSAYQVVTPALTSGQIYTVSYWYRPPTQGRTLTVRLSGASLSSNPDTEVAGLYRRINSLQGGLSELRAWFCDHAVASRRQLFEILSQFWENHFVTQYQKSADYLGQYESGLRGRLATDWEVREMNQWRNAMLNPQCTFQDLLRISAESPAMIVYLDTVNSKGSGNTVANENYTREILELFTFGVDNGYDQNDIVQMSRAWTGWSVELVDHANANNPFAPASVTYYPNINNTSRRPTRSAPGPSTSSPPTTGQIVARFSLARPCRPGLARPGQDATTNSPSPAGPAPTAYRMVTMSSPIWPISPSRRNTSASNSAGFLSTTPSRIPPVSREHSIMISTITPTRTGRRRPNWCTNACSPGKTAIPKASCGPCSM